MNQQASRAQLWIAGGGIAGVAAAAFAIRDGGVPGSQIHILEELVAQGVEVRFATRVTDVEFTTQGRERRATRLAFETRDGASSIALGPDDYALITLGSIAADATYGSNDRAPALIRDRRDHGWMLWQTLADKAPDFGRPAAFYGNIDENKWESFTLTMRGDRLLRRIVEISGNAPGTGALMTWVDSPWLMSIVVPHQPRFRDLPPDTYTLWGYGLFVDKPGAYVARPMAAATGHGMRDPKVMMSALTAAFGV